MYNCLLVQNPLMVNQPSPFTTQNARSYFSFLVLPVNVSIDLVIPKALSIKYVALIAITLKYFSTDLKRDGKRSSTFKKYLKGQCPNKCRKYLTLQRAKSHEISLHRHAKMSYYFLPHNDVIYNTFFRLLFCKAVDECTIYILLLHIMAI